MSGLAGDGQPVDLGDGVVAVERASPASLDELRDLVRAAARERVAIYPQGGRTSLDYGNPPARPGLALDTRGLARTVDYPASDMTVTVEAGLTIGALQSILGKEGQWLPLDVPQPDSATVGGVFATTFAGPRRLGWGRPRDQILGVAFVTSNGDLVRGGGRVVKNVAGYDFPRLLTGSLGTLGILCELTLKVRPVPEASALLLFGCDSLASAASALERLNTSRARPVAVELLNRASLASVLARDAPMPDWAILLGVEDNRASVLWQTNALRDELKDLKELSISIDDARTVWKRLVEHTAGADASVAAHANLRPSRVPDLAGYLDQQGWAVHCHALSGIVRAFQANAGTNVEEVEGTIVEARRVAVEGDGNLTLARCPTHWKERLHVWGQARADWPHMRRVQQALDPAGIMNPGRFVENT